jgi:hypothetical protein
LSQRLGQKSNIASIFYLSRRGLKKFQELLPSDLLGATETCYEKFLSENKIDFVLDLGLEKFTLITRENHQSFSNSSFSLESFLPCREILSTQLLNPIELDRNQRGSIGKETLSFEPGPLFLGRGQKLTALDGFMHRALDQRQSPFGNQDLRDIFLTKDCDLKFRRTETALKTLAKNSLYSSQTGSEFRDLILEEFIRKLWSELALRVSAGSKGLAAGPMIDLIFPERRSEYLENGSFILPIQKTNFKLQVTKDFF